MRLADLNLMIFPRDVELTRRALLASLLWACSGLSLAAGHTPGEVLVIGVDPHYPPYSFYDADQQLTGLDPSLAREACRAIGVTPRFVPIAWNRKDELMTSGRIDCVWSCFTVDGRENQYRLIPYLYSRQIVVVPKESPVQTLDDLAECIVALQSATATERFLLRDPRAPRVKELISLPTTSGALLAVMNGYAQAAAGHEAALRRLVRDVPGRYRELEVPLLAVKLGVAFPLKSRRLRLFERLKNELARMALTGETARWASVYHLDPAKVVLMPDKGRTPDGAR